LRRAAVFALAVACANESDPATWVHRLEDAKRRAEAVEKLEALRGDAGARDDVILEPLARTYVTGDLEPAARSKLLAMLASTDDARVELPLRQALDECSVDVKPAADAVRRRHDKVAPALKASLFSCFAKYAPSKGSREAGDALKDAILAVKDPSWTPKAIAMLAAPIDESASLDEQGRKRFNDQLDFWQRTAVELLGASGDKSAAKPLALALTTKNKRGLAPSAKLALASIARDAEPVLAAALDRSDPDLAKARAEWSRDDAAATVIDALASTGLTSARDAVLAVLPKLDNDANRAAAVQSFPWFPADPRLESSLQTVYASLPPLGTARAALLLVAGDLFEPHLLPWVMHEATTGTAKGDAILGVRASAIQSAIKLMGPEDKPAVADAVDLLENRSGLSPMERLEIGKNLHVLFDWASRAIDACGKDAACHVKILDEPIPPEANVHWKWIKAATMCGLYGDDKTRAALVAKARVVKNPGVRKAMALAIAHLAPNGDVSAAAALDAIASAESLRQDDPLAVVAAILRARAP
jgi:hypothetical protein